MQIESLNTPHKDVENFMTLTMRVPDEPDRKTHMHWLFVVDKSGSMFTSGNKDNRTRLEHVQHTLSNMMEYLKKHAIDTSSIHKLTIIWFNDNANTELNPALTFEILKDTNLTPYHDLIMSQSPEGSTNISAALNTADVLIPKTSINKTAIVFMSDGEPTTGICDHSALQEIVHKLVDRVEGSNPCMLSTIFIGYGAGERGLMEKLADVKTGEYHCVESEEGAGIVYGEIAHTILKEQRRECSISVENGLIYDFVKNEWDKNLMIGRMAAGCERVFHIKSSNPDELSVSITYNDYKADQGVWQNETDVITDITPPSDGIKNKTVEIYNIRQGVLELLSEARLWKQTQPISRHFGQVNTPAHFTRQLRMAMPKPPPIHRQINQPVAPWAGVNMPTLPALAVNPPLPPTTPTQPQISKPLPNRITSAPVNGRYGSPQLKQPVSSDITEYNDLKMRLDAKLASVKQHIRSLTEEGNSEYANGIGILQMLTDDLFITIESLDRPTGLTNIIARQTSQGRQRAYNTVNADDFNSQDHEVSSSLTSPYAPVSALACMRSISQPTTIPVEVNNCPSSADVSSPSSTN